MDTHRYKVTGGGGRPKWNTGPLVSLLEAIPTVQTYLVIYRAFPPRHILNEILSAGVDDAGMSGRCEWTPFTLDGKWNSPEKVER